MGKNIDLLKKEIKDKYSCSTSSSWQPEWDRVVNINLGTLFGLLDQLEEPEKVVVPAFVVDWFEENKDNFEQKIYELCVDLDRKALSTHNEFENWFMLNQNKPTETLVKMKLYGYEVEKEKLYYVRMTEEFAEQLGMSQYRYLNFNEFVEETFFGDKYEVMKIKTVYIKKEAENWIEKLDKLDIEMVEVEEVSE